MRSRTLKQAVRGQLGTISQRLELRRRDLRVDATAQTAVSGGDDAFTTYELGEALNPLGDQLRVFHHVGRVRHPPGTSTFPSGRTVSCQMFHSCSWRTLPASKEYDPALMPSTRSTM